MKEEGAGGRERKGMERDRDEGRVDSGQRKGRGGDEREEEEKGEAKRGASERTRRGLRT